MAQCGCRRIIQVDAAHWWWMRRFPLLCIALWVPRKVLYICKELLLLLLWALQTIRCRHCQPGSCWWMEFIYPSSTKYSMPGSSTKIMASAANFRHFCSWPVLYTDCWMDLKAYNPLCSNTRSHLTDDDLEGVCWYVSEEYYFSSSNRY